MVRRRHLDNSASSLGAGGAGTRPGDDFGARPAYTQGGDSGSAASGLSAHKGYSRPDPNRAAPPPLPPTAAPAITPRINNPETVKLFTIVFLGFLGSIIAILLVQGEGSHAQISSSCTRVPQLQDSVAAMKLTASTEKARAARLTEEKATLERQLSVLNRQLEQQQSQATQSAQAQQESKDSLLQQLRDHREEISAIRRDQSRMESDLHQQIVATKRCQANQALATSVHSSHPSLVALQGEGYWPSYSNSVSSAALCLIPSLAVIRSLFTLRNSNAALKSYEYTVMM